MYKSLKPILKKELQKIHASGLHKQERVISSQQGRYIEVGGKKYLNFCANNYLGLAGSKLLISSAKKALDKYGFGLSSVRFICGTQDIHKELERKTAEFVGKEDAILYSSCMSANIGFFASFLTDEDVILSDALNHASIIDGIRMCKAERYIYKHMDMADLEEALRRFRQAHRRQSQDILQASRIAPVQGRRTICIVTDGVFSMDGDIASLKEICILAEKYNALVVVDDSHATGFMGKNGRGTHEYHGVLKKVDVITSTYGKALGGASGGFIAGPKDLIALLRERSRTYLFSNSLPPVVASTAIFAINHISKRPKLRENLWNNTLYFRDEMTKAGFSVPKSAHPIVPVMLGGAEKSQAMAKAMLEQGIYVVAFSYPVVPQNEARIRVQISSEHTKSDIDRLVKSFKSNL